MRSSVLAEEAISRGFECIFVGRISNLEWVSGRIANLGFSQVIMDECSFKANKELDVLVVDSYDISVSDLFIAKNHWKLVLSICDAFTPNYDSDIELRPGLVAAESVHDAPILLSGPDYVLIRNGIGKSKREKSVGDVLKLLILGGGSDPFGFVTAIAEVVGFMDLNLEVHIFTDRTITGNSNVNFVQHPIGFELDFIANDVDLVFTTASTSSLEFIAREIPTGVVCAVDNQEDYYVSLGRMGYAAQLGVRNSDSGWEFNSTIIKELLESQEKRDSLKEAIRGVIDLKGAARVIDVLESLG
ncbi:spsG Spore coat polysaccharide biosynthesis protein, predicted glycosyltransferase [Candidatus Nanopelagicaceae bacterium]